MLLDIQIKIHAVYDSQLYCGMEKQEQLVGGCVGGCY